MWVTVSPLGRGQLKVAGPAYVGYLGIGHRARGELEAVGRELVGEVGGAGRDVDVLRLRQYLPRSLLAVGCHPDAVGAPLPAGALKHGHTLLRVIWVCVQQGYRRAVQPVGNQEIAEPSGMLIGDAAWSFDDGTHLRPIDHVHD